MFKGLKALFSDEFSYRSDRGVKINVRHNYYGAPRASVDFSDPQTKEIMREEMAKWAQYKIVNGRLVKRDD